MTASPSALSACVGCLWAVVLLVACGGGGGGGSSPSAPAPTLAAPASSNNAPVAHAGVDQVAVRGAEVTVHGGLSSDPDGDDLTWRWSLDSRPTGSVSTLDAATVTATFSVDVTGRYEVGLVVSDGTDESGRDAVIIEVVARRALLADGTVSGMWPSYAGNMSANKYAPLGGIGPDNFGDLDVAWRWRSPDNDVTVAQSTRFEATPLMIDGVLYTSTSFSRVAAIDAGSGETLWVYDPETYLYGRPPNNGFLHRGVAYAEHGGRRYVYIATGDARLIALNPVSGVPVAEFGQNGEVNLLDDIPRLDQDEGRMEEGRQIQFGNTSPPLVCDDVLVVGSSVHDGTVLPPAPPGDVRGFDLATGALRWTFHTVPRAGEFGVETWEDESWRDHGNSNVWAPMSADAERGIVYLPVSCPTNNYYGGRHPGDNLFANSVVALDCATGERRWHYQTVHHDIWDYDLPAAPNLVDISVDGRDIAALAQVSKQGFVYVLDRLTGEPVWPIEEVPVPASTVPGEITAPTQPIPTRPPPFERQGVVREDVVDPSLLEGYDLGPLFSPPTVRGRLISPGEGGGANWGGASFDPRTGMLYVSSLGPLTVGVRMRDGGRPNFYWGERAFGYGANERTLLYRTGSETCPRCTGSSITAYDLHTGTIAWQAPSMSVAGQFGMGASLVTETLLFASNRSASSLAVFDKANGDLLGAVPLGGRGTGAPMTYVLDGRQYIVVAVGEGDAVAELVALALGV